MHCNKIHCFPITFVLRVWPSEDAVISKQVLESWSLSSRFAIARELYFLPQYTEIMSCLKPSPVVNQKKTPDSESYVHRVLFLAVLLAC